MVTCRTFYEKKKEVKETDLMFRLSTYALITHEEQLLAMHLPESGMYSLPGGGVDLGEGIEDALLREVNEETGLTIAIDEFISFEEDFFYYDPACEAYHSVLFFYVCSIRAGDPAKLVHTDSGEAHTEDPRWIPLSDVQINAFVPPARRALKTWFTSRV